MSINVFKKLPGNKITFTDRSVLCNELKVVGSRPEVIFYMHGSRKCRMYDVLLFIRYDTRCYINVRSKANMRLL